MIDIGPHLLGRRYEADARDYLFAGVLAAMPDAPDESVLDEPIKSLIGKGWHYFLDVYRLIDAIEDGTTPKPAPKPPTPAPAPQPGGVILWGDDARLNQGRTGHCVGFGWAGWGDSLPVRDSYTDADANAVYYAAKVIDGEPGQENGSTVRSGAKAMQQRGRLSAYAFAASVDEVKVALRSGPVVFGTDWTQDMFKPDAHGLVSPTGPIAGGHCYLCIGYDPEQGVFRFRNSWGAEWGLNGDFLVHEDDAAKLLAQQGEACVAVELPLPATTTIAAEAEPGEEEEA